MEREELVGRERELAVLVGWLDSAVGGQPRVVLCRGEPGVGKTRLAEELSRLAGIRGLVVGWGLAVEAAGAPPYWPWRQVLRAVLSVVDLAALAGEHRLTADLGRLAPEVFTGSGGRSADGGSVEDRFRQFDAVGQLLRQVTLRSPLMIVLDDAHWADHSSLLLLQHLARTVTGERLLVVVNYRDSEPVRGVLTELLREPVTRQIDLRGLTVPAVGRQLVAVVGRDVADIEIERVHALTGGNPFFVAEIGRVLADRDAAAPTSMVTATVRAAIDARLDRLSPQCVRLLRAASIAGRDFSVAVVAAMTGSPVLSCLGPLDEAIGAGLVEPTSVPGAHRFVHALVRDAIEAGLGTSERVRLHRAAAEAVEEFHAGRLEPHLSDLARHWAVAAIQGECAMAAGWIERAGQEAMRSLAYEEGTRLYRLALGVGADEIDEIGRCRLLLALGAALHLVADVAGRLDVCREAAALARRLGRADLLAQAALTLEGVGEARSDSASRHLCVQALAALDPGPTALRARVTARYAETSMYLADIEAAGPASMRALAAAQGCGDPGALEAALTARALVCSGPDGPRERAHLADRMLDLGRTTDSPAIQMSGHLWRIDAAFDRGDLPGVAQQLVALDACVHEVRGPLARWQMLRVRAALAQAQARFEDARDLTDQAFAAIAPTGHPTGYPTRVGLLSALGHHIGHGVDGSGALAAGGLVDAPAGKRGSHTAGVLDVIGPAYLLASAGRIAEAAAVYRALGPVGRWRPRPHVALGSYALAVVVAIAVGLPDDVVALREVLADYRGHHVAARGGGVWYFGPVELWSGKAAAHLGLLDDAVADLELAADACAANGAAGFHAEAHYELAAVLARRARPGDRVRARALATTCAGQVELLGMVPFTAMAGRLRDQLGPSALLTVREREVAALVAQGLTNREIAVRLYLSERTAQNHVQHILTKLDLANRSQIAVWVTGQDVSSR